MLCCSQTDSSCVLSFSNMTPNSTMLQTPSSSKTKGVGPPTPNTEANPPPSSESLIYKPERTRCTPNIYVKCGTDGQEWNKSQALAHKLRNSSFFFRCVSGLSMPSPNGPRRGSGPLPRGGVPISRSYSARPRLRPCPLRLDSPLTRLIGGLPGVAPWCNGGEGGVGG